jgi:hypothetical protein
MAVGFLSVDERFMDREIKVGMTPMGLTTETKPADSCKYSFQFSINHTSLKALAKA